jgi:hypothetical protein
MRILSASLTTSGAFNARDADAVETPAARATSLSLILGTTVFATLQPFPDYACRKRFQKSLTCYTED